jgi:hypothetical protein
MGLINLKTNLKSLRYGKDTLGGGDSGQPYVQTPIPDSFNDLGANEDFILRGGINADKDSLTDIKRLGKMFTDTKSPNGLIFISKQQILSRTAVRTQTSGILNEGIYSPLNTLAQAGVVAFGGHLNKQGQNPFAQTGAYAVNEALYNTKVNKFIPKSENRLVNLYDLNSNGKNGENKDGTTLNNDINVMTYTGGPDSILGVGNTNIRYSLSSRTPLTKNPKSFNFTTSETSLGQNDWAFSSQLIEQQEDNTAKYGASNPKIQDFRQVLRDKLGKTTTDGIKATNSGATSLSQDYSIGGAVNFTQRVNIGDPGQRGNNNYSDYAKGVRNKQDSNPNSAYGYIGFQPSGLDKINSLPIYRSEAVNTSYPVNDFVKFRIAVIDNDSPNYKTFMHFRAFLGPISDSYNATWNSTQYLRKR